MNGGECRMNNFFLMEYQLACYLLSKVDSTIKQFSLLAKKGILRKDITINWDKKGISDIGQKIWFQT